MGKIAEILLYFVLIVAEIMFICSISALAYLGLRSETQTIYFLSSGILLILGCFFNMMLYYYWDEIGLGRQLIDIGSFFIEKTARIIYVLAFACLCSFGIIIYWCAGIIMFASFEIIENKKEIINMKSETLIPNKDFRYSWTYHAI